ncbi:unnamed protein product, partial [Owenia fusiformis]
KRSTRNICKSCGNFKCDSAEHREDAHEDNVEHERKTYVKKSTRNICKSCGNFKCDSTEHREDAHEDNVEHERKPYVKRSTRNICIVIYMRSNFKCALTGYSQPTRKDLPMRKMKIWSM